MNKKLIAKIQARDRFFELWAQWGQAIAPDPAHWHIWQQALTRADDPVVEELRLAVNQLFTAHDEAAKEGF